MSWAKQSYERVQTIYAKIYDAIAVKTNAELKAREVLIRGEVLRRKFSKRQLTILTFINSFSYLYGKESAIIPKLKDFEIAGISATKVKDELTKLVEMGVITWARHKDTNEFSINDPRGWTLPYHSLYNDIRSRELIAINLKHAGVTSEVLSKLKNELEEEKRRQT